MTRIGRAIVETAQEYYNELVLPTMALCELELELRKRERARRRPHAPFPTVLATLMEADYIRIEPLGTEQVRIMPDLLAIPEMHDRIIAAHAVSNDAPLMTTDRQIRDSGVVECVW